MQERNPGLFMYVPFRDKKPWRIDSNAYQTRNVKTSNDPSSVLGHFNFLRSIYLALIFKFLGSNSELFWQSNYGAGGLRSLLLQMTANRLLYH